MNSNEIEKSRKKLIAGVRDFQERVFPQMKDTYERVVREGQKPHALMITCADSRIDPELITQSGPGEIFVCRNIGNIVPAYGEVLGGVSAIIEYAVAALRVSHVVICGHTECGAMDALVHPERTNGLRTVQSWLRNSEAALRAVRRRKTISDEDPPFEDLVEENVLLQLHHLRSHPSVVEQLAGGELALSGWVYDIGQGIVRIYSEEQRKFIPAAGHSPATSGAGND
jgi:carbonic anhydrase